jgi:hypothetical protein
VRALHFWQTIVADRSDMLEELVGLLAAERVSYCVIGGQAVNAYVGCEPGGRPAGQVWAVLDTDRRPSKRQKDLADIARILEVYPALREQVPQEVLQRLM